MENNKSIKEPITTETESNLLQKVIDKHNIDMSIWYVDSFKIKDGAWNTAAKKREQSLTWTKETDANGKPLQIMEGYSKHYPEFMTINNKTYYIEVTFKRIIANNDISVDKLVKAYASDIPKFKYSSKQPAFKVGSGTALEMATLDAHLGKLAWLQETGYRNYDLDIAIKDFQYANDNLLNWGTPFRPEKIIYIVGQDLFHMDNLAGHTTSGDHTLDVDGRITKVNEKAFEVVTKNIYKCRSVAPVEVIWSPGNHDYLMSYMLCFALKEHFRNDPFVEVDIDKISRKARLWGNLLVGWTHRITGRHNTWGNELAQAFPELWAKSKFREWHHGDQHKKQDVKLIPTFTNGGVLCRQLTALSPVDKWHFENLFTDAIPGGEAFLWSKDQGIFANFIAWTGQYELNRNKLVK